MTVVPPAYEYCKELLSNTYAFLFMCKYQLFVTLPSHVSKVISML